ncbi:MAG: zinc-dependent metalloprotease [Acidimicrobiia bacterium]
MADDPQTGGPEPPDPSDGRPGEPEGPFGGQFGLPFDLSQIDLNEAMRILQSPGPLNWEVARQTAEQVALESEDEGPLDDTVAPTARAELLELAHTAVGPVITETGLSDVLTVPVEVVDRRTWARRHLDGLRPVLETLATTMQDSLAADLDAADDTEVEEMTAGMLGMPLGAGGMRGLMGMLGPLLLGAQAGSMIGYLAQYALGAYDLPLPSVDPPTITFVAPNLDRFADSWSLEPRDVRLAVAVSETVRAAQRTQPWVRDRLVAIAREYVAAFALDPHAFDDAFGDLDPTDTEAMARIAQRPDVLLGALRNDDQRRILERNQEFTMVLEGHADLVTERITAHLIPDAVRIHEALRRHHVERGEAGRFVEGMLGVELDREHYERGQAFCAGVVERAGVAGLNQLWTGPSRMPTTNELDAPGLWLARLEFDEPD